MRDAYEGPGPGGNGASGHAGPPPAVKSRLAGLGDGPSARDNGASIQLFTLSASPASSSCWQLSLTADLPAPLKQASSRAQQAARPSRLGPHRAPMPPHRSTLITATSISNARALLRLPTRTNPISTTTASASESSHLSSSSRRRAPTSAAAIVSGRLRDVRQGRRTARIPQAQARVQAQAQAMTTRWRQMGRPTVCKLKVRQRLARHRQQSDLDPHRPRPQRLSRTIRACRRLRNGRNSQTGTWLTTRTSSGNWTCSFCTLLCTIGASRLDSAHCCTVGCCI